MIYEDVIEQLQPTAAITALANNPCLCGDLGGSLRRRVGRFSIVRCTQCYLERLEPQPTHAELHQLYTEMYFESSNPASPGYAAYGAMAAALTAAADKQVRALPDANKVSPERKLLDVGCGYGTFLVATRRAGWDSYGVDLSAAAAEAARERYGLDVAIGDFAADGAPGGPYDIVTMWDVAEHFPDPYRAMASAFNALKPGGYLVMSTPDVQSWDARLLGRRWYGYTKVPEHLFYFSPRTLHRVTESVGFRFTSARQWGFVRTWGFCTEKLSVYQPALGRASRWVTDRLGLTHRPLFFPIVDMLMICQRPYES